MYLDRLTWSAVDALDRQQILVLCPVSAVEQHSLHLPLATDDLIARAIVERVESRLADRLLCLPSIWLGCSSHHLAFAGTLSARVETMRHVVHDLAASVVRHGFTTLLFLNSHGGNQAPLAAALQELSDQMPGRRLVAATYWALARDALAALRETPPGGMGHACELETSILLATQPDLVDLAKAEADGIPVRSPFGQSDMLAPAPVTQYQSFAETSRHGGHGDPRPATAAKGEAFLTAIVDAVEALCRDLLEHRL